MSNASAAREVPAEFAGGRVETDQLIPRRHGIDGIAALREIRVDAKVAARASGDEILPADFACGTVESVDVALLSYVGADDNRIRGEDRIAVEAGLAAVLMNVVGPADLASVFVESIELSGTRADVKEISHNCGGRKDSTVRVELPVNGGVGGFLRLRRRVGLSETGESGESQRSDCKQHGLDRIKLDPVHDVAPLWANVRLRLAGKQESGRSVASSIASDLVTRFPQNGTRSVRNPVKTFKLKRPAGMDLVIYLRQKKERGTKTTKRKKWGFRTMPIGVPT